jgi:hypothetical protein
MKRRMREPVTCPKCKSGATLIPFWVISVKFENALVGLCVGGVIALLARLLEWSFEIAIFAAVLAIIPFFVSLICKHWCADCEIEFVENQHSSSNEKTLV